MFRQSLRLQQHIEKRKTYRNRRLEEGKEIRRSLAAAEAVHVARYSLVVVDSLAARKVVVVVDSLPVADMVNLFRVSVSRLVHRTYRKKLYQ